MLPRPQVLSVPRTLPALITAAMAILDGKIGEPASSLENIISKGISSSKLEMMDCLETHTRSVINSDNPNIFNAIMTGHNELMASVEKLKLTVEGRKSQFEGMQIDANTKFEVGDQLLRKGKERSGWVCPLA